jgi:Icc-related predicted phosphoesterase
MKMLFVADLHYTLKQFDWVMANATKYDPIIIGGDLLDLSSALDPDTHRKTVGESSPRLWPARNAKGDCGIPCVLALG